MKAYGWFKRVLIWLRRVIHQDKRLWDEVWPRKEVEFRRRRGVQRRRAWIDEEKRWLRQMRMSIAIAKVSMFVGVMMAGTMMVVSALPVKYQGGDEVAWALVSVGLFLVTLSIRVIREAFRDIIRSL